MMIIDIKIIKAKMYKIVNTEEAVKSALTLKERYLRFRSTNT
jgi:hypothetical protein